MLLAMGEGRCLGARFANEGVDGLLRDKTRPPGRKPLADAVRRKVLAKTAGKVLCVDVARRPLRLPLSAS